MLLSLSIRLPRGPDGIQPIIFRMHSNEMAPIVCYPFCPSSSACIFNVLKSARDLSCSWRRSALWVGIGSCHLRKTVFVSRAEKNAEWLQTWIPLSSSNWQSTCPSLTVLVGSLQQIPEKHLVSRYIPKAIDGFWNEGLLTDQRIRILFGFRIKWITLGLVQGVLSRPFFANADVSQGLLPMPTPLLLFNYGFYLLIPT